MLMRNTYAPEKNCNNVVVTVDADRTATRVNMFSWSRKLNNLSNMKPIYILALVDAPSWEAGN